MEEITTVARLLRQTIYAFATNCLRTYVTVTFVNWHRRDVVFEAGDVYVDYRRRRKMYVIEFLLCCEDALKGGRRYIGD